MSQKVFQKNHSSNCSNGHLDCTLDKPAENFFARKQGFIVWKSESDKQNSTTLLQNIFYSKISSGHEVCSFDNPVDKYSTKSRRNFAQCPKLMSRKPQRILLLKMILLPRGMQFWQPSHTIFEKKIKPFRSRSEQENVRFSSESVSAHLVPMYTWKAVLTTLWKSLSHNDDGFLTNIWKL